MRKCMKTKDKVYNINITDTTTSVQNQYYTKFMVSIVQYGFLAQFIMTGKMCHTHCVITAYIHTMSKQLERRLEGCQFEKETWVLSVLGKILFENILSISTSTGTQKVIKILLKILFWKSI